jgi:hypothetical protein
MGFERIKLVEILQQLYIKEIGCLLMIDIGILFNVQLLLLIIESN